MQRSMVPEARRQGFQRQLQKGCALRGHIDMPTTFPTCSPPGPHRSGLQAWMPFHSHGQAGDRHSVREGGLSMPPALAVHRFPARLGQDIWSPTRSFISPPARPLKPELN